MSVKKFDDGEFVWKNRFNHLKSKIRDLFEEEVEFRDCPPEKVFVTQEEIYVNTDMDLCTNKKYAEENWSEFDTYRLVDAKEKCQHEVTMVFNAAHKNFFCKKCEKELSPVWVTL